MRARKDSLTLMRAKKMEKEEIEFGAVQSCLNLVDFANMKSFNDEKAYLVLKIGVDTVENEPSNVL